MIRNFFLEVSAASTGSAMGSAHGARPREPGVVPGALQLGRPATALNAIRNVYIYIHTYIYIHICTYICIYIYMEDKP